MGYRLGHRLGPRYSFTESGVAYKRAKFSIVSSNAWKRLSANPHKVPKHRGDIHVKKQVVFQIVLKIQCNHCKPARNISECKLTRFKIAQWWRECNLEQCRWENVRELNSDWFGHLHNDDRQQHTQHHGKNRRPPKANFYKSS